MAQHVAAHPDRVLTVTRVLGAGIVPFLVVAAFLLFVFPDRTGTLFAWAIAPPLSAWLLASAYVGGTWFFVRVAIVRRWHRVQHGFPAVVLFAAALLVATLLHLDRFSQNLSFVVWLVLYATTPFAVAAVAIAQRRWASADPEPTHEVLLPRAVAVPLAAVGATAFVAGAAVYAAPATVAGSWPWELTPLTGRVVGSVLSLTGVVNAALLWDRRWSAFRILFQAQLVSLAAIVASLARGWDQLRWELPTAPAFVALVLIAAVLYAAVTAWCEILARKGAPPGMKRGDEAPRSSPGGAV